MKDKNGRIIEVSDVLTYTYSLITMSTTQNVVVLKAQRKQVLVVGQQYYHNKYSEAYSFWIHKSNQIEVLTPEKQFLMKLED